MAAFTWLLIVFTAAMFALHLTSGRLLRRALAGNRSSSGLTVVNIVRFEAVYYAVLAVYVALRPSVTLLIPLIVLGVIHLLAWIVAEGAHNLASSLPARTIALVQGFDWGEALVLVWIGWRLSHAVLA